MAHLALAWLLTTLLPLPAQDPTPPDNPPAPTENTEPNTQNPTLNENSPLNQDNDQPANPPENAAAPANPDNAENPDPPAPPANAAPPAGNPDNAEPPPPQDNPAAPDDPPDPVAEAVTRLRNGLLNISILAEVLPHLSNPEHRDAIRDAILNANNPPRDDLVTLLKFPLLAVRLGALELLEEWAGGDLGFNPWLPTDAPENTAALTRWTAWAGAKDHRPPTDGLFSEDQRRSYLRDLLGSDADKATRARKMLEAEGIPAVGFLENFLASTETLPPGSRARIREAQYQITLARQLGDQAAVTARHLAFGSRDQLLSALAMVRSGGPMALPILRDFIDHPDPLVRETAIDSLLASGGTDAVPLVAPLLAQEADVNVIHGALRRLKDLRSKATEELVSSFLKHPDEDLRVSAIQTCLVISGDSDRFSYSSSAGKKNASQDPLIIECLSDPRWRIRAAALEYVVKRRPKSMKDLCVQLLDDPDEFVRSGAVKAVVALGVKSAAPKLREMWLKDVTLAPLLLEGLQGLNSPPDDALLTALDTAPTEVRLAALRAPGASALLTRYATDPNPDIACAALRQIAADEDLVKKNTHATILINALKENQPAKATAILERLQLPQRRSSPQDANLLSALQNAPTTQGPTPLDPIYNAFLKAAGNATPAATPTPAAIPAAHSKLIEELLRFTQPDTPPALRLAAACNLARSDHPQGSACLLTLLPDATTADKIAICSSIGTPSSKEALELLDRLLADPVPEIRSAAAVRALANEKARAIISRLLNLLASPNSPLQPHEVYSYSFESALRNNSSLFHTWALQVLESKTASSPLKILALVCSRNSNNPKLIDITTTLTRSPNEHLRRAAWHTLLTIKPTEIPNAAPTIAADPAAFVRAVLPDRAATTTNNRWQHHFSDTTVVEDNRYDSNSRSPKATQPTLDALTRLARQDPSPLVRFEAAFALIAHGSPTDLEAFSSLTARMPKESYVSYRIANWLEENASRTTPALAPLLAMVDTKSIDADKLKILNNRIAPKQTKGFATFASLAEQAATKNAPDTPLLTPENPAEPATPARTKIDLVYFYKPGCQECAKARELLDQLKADFPTLEVSEFNILDPAGTLLNQALCDRLAVPSVKQTVAPSVFTQAGFVVATDITPPNLTALLEKTRQSPEDPSWRTIEQPEQEAAAREVDRRYEAITLPVVLLGGLIDGLNPCAFATIIFFLSYLRVARRTPREMLMVGAAFITAVFLAYLTAGLALYQLLDTLHARFAGLQHWLNAAFGLLALFAAWLSLRDALRARAGRLDEMTLQLPDALKGRIRSVIRTGAKARNFVIAAFIAGWLISLLELACTGQVYAPIIYQIQRGRLDAVAWLVVYNLAFITPLVVIFALAYGGLRSESLIAFQKRHTFGVKIALALVFLALALFIFLGPSLI